MRGLKAKTPTDDDVFVEARLRPEAKTKAEGMEKRVRLLRDDTILIVRIAVFIPGLLTGAEGR